MAKSSKTLGSCFSNLEGSCWRFASPPTLKSMPSLHFCADTTTGQSCYSHSCCSCASAQVSRRRQCQDRLICSLKIQRHYVMLGNTSERRLGNGCVHGDHENVLQYLHLEKGCILLVTSRTCVERGSANSFQKGPDGKYLRVCGPLTDYHTFFFVFVLFCFLQSLKNTNNLSQLTGCEPDLAQGLQLVNPWCQRNIPLTLCVPCLSKRLLRAIQGRDDSLYSPQLLARCLVNRLNKYW